MLPHTSPHPAPQVGKTTLIKGLIKHYTRQDVRDIKGPITLIAGKARRQAGPGCTCWRRGWAGAATAGGPGWAAVVFCGA